MRGVKYRHDSFRSRDCQWSDWKVKAWPESLGVLHSLARGVLPNPLACQVDGAGPTMARSFTSNLPFGQKVQVRVPGYSETGQGSRCDLATADVRIVGTKMAST